MQMSGRFFFGGGRGAEFYQRRSLFITGTRDPYNYVDHDHDVVSGGLYWKDIEDDLRGA